MLNSLLTNPRFVSWILIGGEQSANQMPHDVNLGELTTVNLDIILLAPTLGPYRICVD